MAATRYGLGRQPNVFPFPAALLEILFRVGRREEIYQRLSHPQVG